MQKFERFVGDPQAGGVLRHEAIEHDFAARGLKALYVDPFS
jgi:hypothetical protein